MDGGAALWGRSIDRAREDIRVPAALLALNLVDGIFTLTFLQLRVAEEANPLMKLAFRASPLAFMGLKLLAVQIGVWMLWKYRGAPAAKTALGVGVLLYGAIACWHLVFLVRLGAH